jgi:hypothetical protein
VINLDRRGRLKLADKLEGMMAAKPYDDYLLIDRRLLKVFIVYLRSFERKEL